MLSKDAKYVTLVNIELMNKDENRMDFLRELEEMVFPFCVSHRVLESFSREDDQPDFSLELEIEGGDNRDEVRKALNRMKLDLIFSLGIRPMVLLLDSELESGLELQEQT